MYLKTCNVFLYNPLIHSYSQPLKTGVLWSKCPTISSSSITSIFLKSLKTFLFNKAFNL